jgi:hypothetical protein
VKDVSCRVGDTAEQGICVDRTYGEDENRAKHGVPQPFARATGSGGLEHDSVPACQIGPNRHCDASRGMDGAGDLLVRLAHASLCGLGGVRVERNWNRNNERTQPFEQE